MSRNKHIFDLTPEEQAGRVRDRIAEVQQQNLDKGLYNLFLNPEDRGQMIREYRDHSEVVQVNAHTGRTRVIKRLNR